VRTFRDWNDPASGYFEMDRVAHCGKSTAGSYVHSLDLTDLAFGWTETRAMIVREQTLVIETVGEIRTQLPFPMRGLDVDNDSAFMLKAGRGVVLFLLGRIDSSPGRCSGGAAKGASFRPCRPTLQRRLAFR